MLQTIEILKSKKGLEILQFFLDKHEVWFYQSEVTKKLKFSPVTVIKWLKILTEKAFVELKITGRLKYYRLNPANPMVRQIKILFTITNLYETVKELKGENVEVYLYGSCARGEDTPQSDVDILLIGKIERNVLVRWTELVESKVNKKVRPLVLTPLEYSNMARKDRAFYESLEKSRIRLL